MGLFRNEQIFFSLNIVFMKFLKLPAKDKGINDYPISNNIDGIRVEYTGRNGVKYELFVVEFNGMPSVGTSLKTGNNIILGS